MLLVDDVLAFDDRKHVDADSHSAAVRLALLLGILNALPILPLNALQRLKPWLGVGGTARKELQVCALGPPLPYTHTHTLDP